MTRHAEVSHKRHEMRCQISVASSLLIALACAPQSEFHIRAWLLRNMGRRLSFIAHNTEVGKAQAEESESLLYAPVFPGG